ncbi:MAG: CvpA family protein [Wenzhouxiangellaceae bacterium]|nr:CvpA family protein [Wenzhouxiangellaceae bacterium]
MNPADLAILGVLVVSVVVSLFRGFIREVFSIVVWIAAIVAAFQVSGPLSEAMAPYVELPSARVLLAFSGVFLLVLVIGGLIGYVVGRVVEKSGLSPTDRMFGGLFGLVRGVVIVAAAVVLARFTPFPSDPWWQESDLLPAFERLADVAVDYLPEGLRDLLDAPAGSTPESEAQPIDEIPMEMT